MTKRNEQPTNAWEYVDWLYLSGRLTAEEHNKLKLFLIKLEEEAGINSYSEEGC
jgi:hypothetical protein